MNEPRGGEPGTATSNFASSATRQLPSHSEPSRHALPASLVLQMQVSVSAIPCFCQSPLHASHPALVVGRGGFTAAAGVAGCDVEGPVAGPVLDVTLALH